MIYITAFFAFMAGISSAALLSVIDSINERRSVKLLIILAWSFNFSLSLGGTIANLILFHYGFF